VKGAPVPLPARVYRVSPEKSATVVFFYGGGWVAGDFETDDRQPGRLAIETGAIVAWRVWFNSASTAMRCCPYLGAPGVLISGAVSPISNPLKYTSAHTGQSFWRMMICHRPVPEFIIARFSESIR
jgi:hypothetical protein